MLSVAACIEQLMQASKETSEKSQTRASIVALHDALGRVLAEDVYSQHDVPPQDNSAMDGYAVNHEQVSANTPIRVSQRIQAGEVPKPLEAGTAARIFTGAEIPAGATAVVMQENCVVTHDGKNTDFVTIQSETKQHSNIRSRGQDISKSSVVLEKGYPLRAQELGLLASIGIAEVTTYVPLKIGILNTGNELVEPGNPLPPGKIYNSNRFLLDAILKGWGFETAHNNIAIDDFSHTRDALISLASSCDIVISTGGVSVGEEDHIKTAISSLGSLDLWRVAIKPGKPFAFGDISGTPFLGLPGNPVSAFVTLLILARPYLLTLQGVANEKLFAPASKARALFSRKSGKRVEYLRGKLGENGVEIFPNQSSGVLSSAAWGDCFVVQDVGQDIAEGDLVNVISYSQLLGN